MKVYLIGDASGVTGIFERFDQVQDAEEIWAFDVNIKSDGKCIRKPKKNEVKKAESGRDYKTIAEKAMLETGVVIERQAPKTKPPTKRKKSNA